MGREKKGYEGVHSCKTQRQTIQCPLALLALILPDIFMICTYSLHLG